MVMDRATRNRMCRGCLISTQSYSIHATPWQRTFGWTEPGDSHGCVNTPTSDAEWIDHWANLGTSVMSHYEKRLSQDTFT